jgi:hypothetical protein
MAIEKKLVERTISKLTNFPTTLNAARSTSASPGLIILNSLNALVAAPAADDADVKPEPDFFPELAFHPD